MRAAVVAMAIVYTGILVWNCARVGITIDEPTRLLGAYLYWMNLPDAPPQDQPPLLSIMTGWAPRLLDIPLDRDNDIWTRVWKDHIFSSILDRRPGPEIGRLFFLARLGVIIFPLLTAWLLWWWGRQIYSEPAALLVVALFFLLPSVRAHGALITSDMMSSWAYLWSTYAAWRFWKDPSWRRAAWLGLAVGVALTTKLSMLIVPFLAAGVVIAACARRRVEPLRAFARLALVAGLVWLTLAASYKFDVGRMKPSDFAEMETAGAYKGAMLKAARLMKVIPLPYDLHKGIRLMGHWSQDGIQTFLLGEIRQHGYWAYYLVCLALKPPIGVQLLVVAGLGLLGWGLWRRTIGPEGYFLAAAAAIYLGFASASSVQLGIRLILPAVVVLLLCAGYAIEWLLAGRVKQAALAAVLGFILISTARIFPYDIAYFNEWAGGPENGWRYLSDSNIDWGGNLPDLARYMKENGIRQINWVPFGFDKMHRYFQDGQIQLVPSPWTPHLLDGPVYHPKPGLYAVNASLLWGQFYTPEYWNFLKYFRDREPDARVGYGIFIYRVTQ